MPVLEHPFQTGTDEPAAEPPAKRAQRQLVDDPVLEPAGARPGRLHPVLVLPAGERSADLHVAEASPGHASLDARYPGYGERPQTDDEPDLGALLDRALPRHLDPLPGRDEALESLRPGVPAEHLVGRGVDPDAADESLSAHDMDNIWTHRSCQSKAAIISVQIQCIPRRREQTWDLKMDNRRTYYYLSDERLAPWAPSSPRPSSPRLPPFRREKREKFVGESF